MDSKDFIKLLSNPDEVEKMSVDELKKLSIEYPYSQPVQLLYTIRLSQSSEYLFNRQLGKTSILTDDRTVLFDLFERDREEVGATTVLQQGSVKEPQAPAVEALLTREDQEEQPRDSAVEEQSAATIEAEDSSSGNSSVAEEEEVARDMETTDQEPALPEPQVTVGPPTEQRVERKPLDLSGLSPKEKVAAILAENKRVREQFESKKPATPRVEEPVRREEVAPAVESTREVEQQQPEKTLPAETPEELPAETQSEVTVTTEAPFEIEGEEAGENVEVEEAGPPVDSGILEEENKEDSSEEEVEEELPVFTIDEEPQEVVFEIEEEPGVGEDTGIEGSEPAMAPHKPSDLKHESHSFAEWLHILKTSKKAEAESEPEVQQNQRPVEKPELPVEKKIELLDSFVEKLPELKRKNINAPRPDKPSKSEISMGNLGDEEEGSLVTETLAKVYVRQKHYEKAIKAYEIMKLKYPEKSSFFADQISEIRKLINSK